MNDVQVGQWARSIYPWAHKGKWHLIARLTAYAAEALCGQASVSKLEYTETSATYPPKGRACKHCLRTWAKTRSDTQP